MPYKNHLPFRMLSGTVWSPVSRKHRSWRASLPTQAWFSEGLTQRQDTFPKSTTYCSRNTLYLSRAPVFMTWNTWLSVSIDRRAKKNWFRPAYRPVTSKSKQYNCWTRSVRTFYLPSAKKNWNSKGGSSLLTINLVPRETLQLTFSGLKRAKLCLKLTSNVLEKTIHTVVMLMRKWTSWMSSGGALNSFAML